jgi:hypothetical protein
MSMSNLEKSSSNLDLEISLEKAKSRDVPTQPQTGIMNGLERGRGTPADGNITTPVPVFNPADPSQYPDGGARAWLVAFGAFFGVFVSFGWVSCKSLAQLLALHRIPGGMVP